jgi:hypothetical protein
MKVLEGNNSFMIVSTHERCGDLDDFQAGPDRDFAKSLQKNAVSLPPDTRTRTVVGTRRERCILRNPYLLFFIQRHWSAMTRRRG